jgi:translocation and assembly module TamB
MKPRRVLLASALTLLTMIIAIVGLALWVINTQSGTRWAFRIASNALDGALQARRIEGTIAGPLTLSELRYRDPAGGLELVAQRIAVDIEIHELLRKTLHVRNLDARGVAVMLGPPQEKVPPEPSQPFSLQPPLDIELDRLRLADASIQREQQMLAQIDTASAAGAWTDAGVNVRELDVRSPQGEIHFQAAISGNDVYAGTGRGRFRWQVGTRTYAGALQAQAQEALATLSAQLTSPLSARLQFDLQQRKSAPWTLALEVPTFDPSKELMPKSSLRSLAVSLRGAGDLTQATFNGRITVNEEPLQLDRVHLARNPQEIALDALIRPKQGSLRANGTVLLAETPAAAKLDLNWQDVVIPETWAGQVLHTQGEIHFDGSAQAYAANGTLRLGPPQRLANIRLDVKGSPQSVQLKRFDIVQAAGELQASGQLDLQPAIAWQAQARARHFNPGEFAAAWPGDLNFELASRGRMSDQKPQGSLQLTNLSGQLRRRPLRGEADLQVSPDMVLAGTLDVRSGRSRIHVQGERSEVMDARMTIEVPALDDWLPDTGGDLHGQLTATGRWPALKIGGRVRGSSLRMSTASTEALALTFDISDPKNPHGEISLDGSRIATSGLVFDTLRLRAEGDAQKHTLQLDATGQPLATHLQLHGARTSRANAFGWSGTVEQLVLDVQNAARLQLQQPVDVTYSQRAVRVSQACFADGDIRLCLGGNSEPSGALRAQYSLQNVPLALANTFAAASMPISFSGKLDGEGNIQRDAQGRFIGSAALRSAQGNIARRLQPAAEQPEVLLKFDDLRIAAHLDGKAGNGSIDARLNDTGQLQGKLALSGLGEASTNLRGSLNANLPSIAVVEMFAPQLANVQGQVQLRAGVTGTLDTPRIEGELNATNLATDVPALGLKLREGRISVTPRPDGQFALAGSISSGKGALRFDGTGSAAGETRIGVQGQQFLAADIPGAQVIVDPKLQLTRSAQRISLEGDVHIPSAKIDLQKLPRTQSAQNVSSDVVVIDAQTQEEAQRKAMPLHAAIQVSLGEDVALAGFGLDAKVAGQLLVREAPGAPTTGSGEVRVSGTYKAYGQDLTIRQGQLLFAGTPLDNPRLSIVAVREVEPVVAGLRIQGSARNPQLTVFSEPPMAQSNALAYLVTGKPLSEVGAGEGDAVQSAARSLGTAAGGLLAKNIGRRLGVDEVGVKDSEAIGGAALTVGQYLSPRLYLSYGVGLFEPGEVVTLRYKLSKKVAIEALNGPRDSRAGVEYRMEK